tara:strand:- start:8195 stop:8674 length:480 start_codon:yes stop_codon:yes gene_type:complete
MNGTSKAWLALILRDYSQAFYTPHIAALYSHGVCVKILTLFFILISASSFAAKNCGESINATKHQAELFVIELNMDRVELLYFLRKKLNIDGGLQSRTALDEELHSSIMEVLLKSKSKTVMIKRIAEINESFHDFPLQINQAKIEELNTKLAQRLVVGI